MSPISMSPAQGLARTYPRIGQSGDRMRVLRDRQQHADAIRRGAHRSRQTFNQKRVEKNIGARIRKKAWIHRRLHQTRLVVPRRQFAARHLVAVAASLALRPRRQKQRDHRSIHVPICLLFGLCLLGIGRAIDQRHSLAGPPLLSMVLGRRDRGMENFSGSGNEGDGPRTGQALQAVSQSGRRCSHPPPRPSPFFIPRSWFIKESRTIIADCIDHRPPQS